MLIACHKRTNVFFHAIFSHSLSLSLFFFFYLYNIHFSPLFLDIGLFESLPFLFSIYFLKYSHQNITYLGVPLISGRLSYSDCNPLIDRLTERMRAWTAKLLRIRRGRVNREKRERMQREEGEKRREEGEKAETENE